MRMTLGTLFPSDSWLVCQTACVMWTTVDHQLCTVQKCSVHTGTQAESRVENRCSANRSGWGPKFRAFFSFSLFGFFSNFRPSLNCDGPLRVFIIENVLTTHLRSSTQNTHHRTHNTQHRTTQNNKEKHRKHTTNTEQHTTTYNQPHAFFKGFWVWYKEGFSSSGRKKFFFERRTRKGFSSRNKFFELGALSKYLLAKFLPRSAHGRERSLVIRYRQIDEFSPYLSVKTDDIQPLSPQSTNWPFEWFSKSSFVWRFPICQEVVDISQMAIKFHGVWPPRFIQSWL